MSPISEARTDTAAVLAAAMPAVDVIPYPRSDVPNARRVVIASSQVAPAGVACSWQTVQLDVWCITPYTDPGPADDDLEQLLTDTLAALDAAGLAWLTAERGVWAETNPAYRVTIEREC